MNAPVKQSLLLPEAKTAADHLAQCRAILAQPGESPVESAMNEWWGRLKRHQRRALMELAGLARCRVEAKWADLPASNRAAIAIALPDLAAKLCEIRVTLSGVREQAMNYLRKHEAPTVRRLELYEKPVSDEPQQSHEVWKNRHRKDAA